LSIGHVFFWLRETEVRRRRKARARDSSCLAREEYQSLFLSTTISADRDLGVHRILVVPLAVYHPCVDSAVPTHVLRPFVLSGC
jgi:hypothetical protein